MGIDKTLMRMNSDIKDINNLYLLLSKYSNLEEQVAQSAGIPVVSSDMDVFGESMSVQHQVPPSTQDTKLKIKDDFLNQKDWEMFEPKRHTEENLKSKYTKNPDFDPDSSGFEPF